MVDVFENRYGWEGEGGWVLLVHGLVVMAIIGEKTIYIQRLAPRAELFDDLLGRQHSGVRTGVEFDIP